MPGDEQPSKRLKSSVPTQPLADLIYDSVLPFKGRDSLMLQVAENIQHYFDTFVRRSIGREDMLFTVFEGLAGVGKTRCLLETMNEVEKVVNSDTELAKLYTCKGVHAVYVTFNGAAVGNRKPHFFHPAFKETIGHQGIFRAGQIFMQASIVSEIMYGRPWGNLPSELQDVIKEESMLSAVKRVGDHIRKEKLPVNQLVALYVLIDESQILAQTILSENFDGMEFVRGMFSWIAMVMTDWSLGKACNLGMIPIIAGTVVPPVGKWGVCDLLAVRKTLAPLDLDSAVEVLQKSVNDTRFSEIKQGLKILLQDCSCLPRLIMYVYEAWEEVMKRSLPNDELVHQLRQKVFVQVEPWVDIITEGNRQVVKEIVRLCLTGSVMTDNLHVDECRKGYVYAERVQDGWRYCSPRLLVRSIAERVGIPARSIPILPVVAKGPTLEDAFLDTFLALLCLNEGKSIPVHKLFVGAVGKEAVLGMKVDINCGVKQVDEKHQFFIPKEQRFYYKGDSFTVGTDGCSYYLPPCTRERPSFSVLLRCLKNTTVTDARLFLRNDQGETCEFWIQLKGSKDPINWRDAEKWYQAAFNPSLKVSGRRKIYVLCSTKGFSFDTSINEDVLFMNLIHFMPEFLRQSVEN